MEKGVHRAIAIARRAGVPLRIIAKMREPAEVAYFNRWVKPTLCEDIQYLGELTPEERNAQIGGSVALINPINWPEPFGLVMIEALACGTPVIAFANGAAPEIIEHGKTGFLCRDVKDASVWLQRVGDLDRRSCRAAAEGYFSGRRMVDEYECLYLDVLETTAKRWRTVASA